MLKDAGYEQYEISNFSKNGYESKHNMAYWNQEEYIGLGAGASSYYKGERYTNEGNLDKYISKINNDEEIRNLEEVETIESKLREYVILKLRLTEGLCFEEVNDKFGVNIKEIFAKEIEKLLKLNLIEFNKQIDKTYMKLTEKGMDLANIVWEEFI